jgi:hypothetical protein
MARKCSAIWQVERRSLAAGDAIYRLIVIYAASGAMPALRAAGRRSAVQIKVAPKRRGDK